MAAPPKRWQLYTGVVLLGWAAGLQVHMWHIQRRPEFKEKFGGDANQHEPEPKPEPELKPKTQWTFRTRSGSSVWS